MPQSLRVPLNGPGLGGGPVVVDGGHVGLVGRDQQFDQGVLGLERIGPVPENNPIEVQSRIIGVDATNAGQCGRTEPVVAEELRRLGHIRVTRKNATVTPGGPGDCQGLTTHATGPVCRIVAVSGEHGHIRHLDALLRGKARGLDQLTQLRVELLATRLVRGLSQYG